MSREIKGKRLKIGRGKTKLYPLQVLFYIPSEILRIIQRNTTFLLFPSVLAGLISHLESFNYQAFTLGIGSIFLWTLGYGIYSQAENLQNVIIDFFNRFPGVRFQEVSTQRLILRISGGLDMGMIKEDTDGQNFPGMTIRKRIPRVRIIQVDYQNCEQIGGGNIHYLNFDYSSFIFLSQPIEKLRGLSLFYFLHELGHSTDRVRAKRKLTHSYSVALLIANIFSVIVLSGGIQTINWHFLIPFALIFLWLRGMLRSGRSLEEAAADQFAVRYCDSETLRRVKLVLAKYPNVFWEKRMTRKENERRRDHLIYSINQKLDKGNRGLMFENDIQNLQDFFLFPINLRFFAGLFHFGLVTLLYFSLPKTVTFEWNSVLILLIPLGVFSILGMLKLYWFQNQIVQRK